MMPEISNWGVVTVSRVLAAIAKKGRRRRPRRRVLRLAIGPFLPLPFASFLPMEERGSLPSRRGKTDHFPFLPSLCQSLTRAPLHRRFGLPFTVRAEEESIAFDGRRSALSARGGDGGGEGTAERRRRVSDK